MNKHIVIYLYFLVALLIACKEEYNTTRTVESLPTKKLKGEIVNIELYDVKSMIIFDTCLIVLNIHGKDFFHVYNTNTFKLISKFGKKGRGPGEFISPEFTGQVKSNNFGQIELFIYDQVRRRINTINLTDMINKASYNYKVELLPEKLKNISNIIYKNDSLNWVLIPNGNEFKGRFMLFNYKTSNIQFTSYKPDLGFEVHKNNLYAIYNTYTALVNEKKGMFVATPCLIGELDFFSLSGKYIRSTIIERVNEIERAKFAKIIFEVPNIRYYITDIEADNEKIYVLFTVKKYPKLDNNALTKVFVFDWDGVPKEQFNLDKEIHCFAIDWKQNRLIGYCPNEKRPIIMYNLD